MLGRIETVALTAIAKAARGEIAHLSQSALDFAPELGAPPGQIARRVPQSADRRTLRGLLVDHDDLSKDLRQGRPT